MDRLAEQQADIFSRFMLGQIDPVQAARELSALPHVDWNLYWLLPHDLSSCGDLADRLAAFEAELAKRGLGPSAA